MGLCRLFEDDMGVLRGASEKDLIVVDVAILWRRPAVEVGRGIAFARQRIMGLPDIVMDSICKIESQRTLYSFAKKNWC